MKVGKKKAFFHPNSPKMASLMLPGVMPPPPQSVDYTTRVTSWPMFDNDTLGNCTVAAIGHLIQLYSSYTKPAPLVMSNANIINTYSDVGGYVSGDSSTDNGAVEQDVLNYWMNHGVPVNDIVNKITGFAKINVAKKTELQYALYWFGGAYIGIDLPLAWQSTSNWEMPSNLMGANAPGSWGGHAIPVVAYDQDYLTVITWGEKVQLSWAAYESFVDESWAVVDALWANQQGKCPANNFDWSQLLADMSLIQQGVV
jgi:hypothetical protein